MIMTEIEHKTFVKFIWQKVSVITLSMFLAKFSDEYKQKFPENLDIKVDFKLFQCARVLRMTDFDFFSLFI